ncbi:MAG: hypothetical protein ACREIA_25570, partial [Opitutaceae bacterium]
MLKRAAKVAGALDGFLVFGANTMSLFEGCMDALHVAFLVSRCACRSVSAKELRNSACVVWISTP